ncbi:endonuclease domain-containing protein [bacterium]|nr:MAG: endonuclease domain-containing protein [bacterium]
MIRGVRRDPIHIERARQLRKDMGDAERRLWSRLRARRLASYKFRRQHAIGPYIADFASITGRLVVEVDGGEHNELINQRRDAMRTRYLQRAGYRVLRFWNHEVLSETDDVTEAIWNALNAASTSGPLPSGERVG